MSTTTASAPTGAADPADRIGELRNEIDACDAAIIELVQRRLAISREIGALRAAARRHPALAGPRAAGARPVPGGPRPGRRRARHDAAPPGPRPALRPGRGRPDVTSAGAAPSPWAEPPRRGSRHGAEHRRMARISLDPPRSPDLPAHRVVLPPPVRHRRRPGRRDGPQPARAARPTPASRCRVRQVATGSTRPSRHLAEMAAVGHDRLLVVRRLRLLGQPPARAPTRPSWRRAALAGQRRLHRPGAPRPRVRRGDDRHPADRDRRDGRRAARATSATPRWSS